MTRNSSPGPARGFRVLGTASLSSLLVCLPAFAGQVELAGLDSAPTHQRFIVKYRQDSRQPAGGTALTQSMGVAARALTTTAGKPIGVHRLRRLAIGPEVVRTDVPLDRAQAQTLLRKLAADPNVEYVAVDRIYTIDLTPNDTRYSEQWGYSGSYGIKAPQAWDAANGNGVVVAVLDTGITNHSDLNANVVPGYDFITELSFANDGNGRDSDPSDPGDWVAANQCKNGSPASNSSWHGTHVAGTIAAVTNNAKGVAGTAFGAKIEPVRVLGTCGGYDSDIADAIVWASGGSVDGVPANANPAEVINLSLGGGGGCSQTSQDAIDAAVARGTTVVVAAGNSNVNASLGSPANCDKVIVVGASDSAGKRSVWSSLDQSNYGAAVDLAAPGTSILSTVNSGTKGPTSESYASYSGTSMATPHVAGVVALVQSVSNPVKTPAQVEALLKSTVTPFPATPDKPIGAGIVNAQAAVAAARGSGGTSSAQTYSNATALAINDNSTVESSIAVTGRTGAAPASTLVAVDISHTWKGDLKVDLLAPDGSVYVLSNRSGGSADDIRQTFTVNLSSEAINGSWKLRINDNASGDSGRLNSWSITF